MFQVNQIFNAPPISESNLNPHYNFFDLDEWVQEVSGTPEYNERIRVADEIKKCSRTKSQHLNIDNAGITSLPKAIGKLTHLQELCIEHGENAILITELPDTIWDLVNLTHLSIQGTPFLTSLPSKIGNLSNLRELWIGDTQIQEIPPEIGNLRNLRDLMFRDNQLTVVPFQIGNLSDLEELNLGGNPNLSDLPEEIGQLSKLRHLILGGTALSSLPIGIFFLDRLEILELEQIPFSENALARLQTHLNDPSYPHRQISYTPPEDNRLTHTSERSLEELLTELYYFSGREKILFENLLQHPEIENLRSFLGRISYTIDFRQGGEERGALALKITEYLALAETNENYRDRFFACLNEAATTCGDRISLTIIFLGLAKKLTEVNPRDLPNLYELLLGIQSIDFIINLAFERMGGLTAHEGVEIYLGYLTKLKKEFNLPLDIENMLYFRTSDISPGKLKTAKEEVRLNRACLSNQYEFLASHDLWQKALELRYPAAYAEAINTDEPRHALIELTKGALASFNATFRQELTPPPADAPANLENWVLAAQGTREYAGRLEAAARIRNCSKTNSTTLDLQNLMLSSVPEEVTTLRHLRVLNLGQNEISQLPDSIKDLNLRRLVLEGTPLKRNLGAPSKRFSPY